MNLRLCLTWLLLVLGLSFSFADDLDRHAADIVILQAKPVQHELGITDAQRAKMNQAADSHRARLAAYQKQLQASKGKPDQATIYEYYRQLKDQVLDQLTPGQVKRLRELSLQRSGLIALGDSTIGHRVGLSDKQIELIRKGIVSAQKAIKAVSDATAKPIYRKFAGKKPATEAQAEDLRREFDKEVNTALSPKLAALAEKDRRQMLSVLTPGQKAAWKVLLGKPFRMKRG